jgi:hypothetical protein
LLLIGHGHTAARISERRSMKWKWPSLEEAGLTVPHRDVDKEHRREAHIHDHARPAESPG